jgi:hypothetical protein
LGERGEGAWICWDLAGEISFALVTRRGWAGIGGQPCSCLERAPERMMMLVLMSRNGDRDGLRWEVVGDGRTRKSIGRKSVSENKRSSG